MLFRSAFHGIRRVFRGRLFLFLSYTDSPAAKLNSVFQKHQHGDIRLCVLHRDSYQISVRSFMSSWVLQASKKCWNTDKYYKYYNVPVTLRAQVWTKHIRSYYFYLLKTSITSNSSIWLIPALLYVSVSVSSCSLTDQRLVKFSPRLRESSWCEVSSRFSLMSRFSNLRTWKWNLISSDRLMDPHSWNIKGLVRILSAL